jgi:hypothetical protein
MSRAVATKCLLNAVDVTAPATIRHVLDVSQYADIAVALGSTDGLSSTRLLVSTLPHSSPLLEDLDPASNPRWVQVSMSPDPVLTVTGIDSEFGTLLELDAVRSIQLETTVSLDAVAINLDVTLTERS